MMLQNVVQVNHSKFYRNPSNSFGHFKRKQADKQFSNFPNPLQINN
jgi:hypothetical protein